MKIRKAELEERRAKVEERDRKREAERELPSRRSSDNKFIPRMRCFACGATTHIEINCPQLLCKTTPKSETNVSRVGVGILRNDPALKDQSHVASACGQSDNYGIASLFDCVMPSVNGRDLEEPKVDSVVLQSNTVSI